MVAIDDFFTQLCADLGYPAKAATFLVMEKWSQLEGVNSPNGMPFDTSFNPWCTTRIDADIQLQTKDIGYGPGNWNNIPVRMYATMQDGLKATERTLALNYYAHIQQMFKTGTYVDGVQADFQTWIGSPGYAATLASFAQQQYGTTPVVVAPPPISLDEIIEFLGGVDAIRQWNARGNSLAVGFSNVQEQSQETANKLANIALPLANVYADIGRALSQAGGAVTQAGLNRGV